MYKANTGRAEVVNFHSRHRRDQEMETERSDRLKKQRVFVSKARTLLLSQMPSHVCPTLLSVVTVDPKNQHKRLLLWRSEWHQKGSLHSVFLSGYLIVEFP